MDKWIQAFREAKTLEGFDKVIIPGEPETEMESERMKNGISLSGPVADDLTKLAEKFSLEI